MKIKAKDKIQNYAVDDTSIHDIAAGKVYTVIGIEGGYYRIVDESEEPLLYAKELFEVADPTIPSDWVETIFDGESYIEPPETCAPGFYEDYFEGVPYAVKKFKELLKKMFMDK